MPTALELIHIITPSVLALPVLALLPSPAPSPPALPGVRAVTVKTVTPRRGFILLTLVLLAATCAIEAVILIIEILTAKLRSSPDDDLHFLDFYSSSSHGLSAWFVAASAVHSFGGLCIYSGAAILSEWRTRWGDKNLVLLAVLAFGLEVPNLVLSVVREVHAADKYQRVFAILNIVPSCLRLIILPVLVVLVLNPIVRFQAPDERTGLLAETDANADEADVETGSAAAHLVVAPTPQYGTFNGGSTRDPSIATRASTDTPQPPADATAGTATPNPAKKITIPKKLGEKKEEYQGISWKAFWARLRKLWPHLWPSTSWKLQLCCVLCVGLIFVGRGVNALVPMTIGAIVRNLTSNEHGGSGPSPWPPLLLYILLRSMQSGGVLAFLQNVIWVPVQQYADREMQLLTFNHLLDLSLAFHTKRNTGEVLRIIDRGSAINNLFQTLLFTAAPTVLDILLYSAIFFGFYGAFLSGFMMCVMAAYVTFSIVFTGYRTKLRREMVERDIKTRGIASDVLTNWESVKYFTAESRESRRFKDSILAYQTTEAKVTVSFNLLNLGQSFIMTVGLLAGCLIVSLQILNGPWDKDGQPDAASFVTFLMYIQQLYGPLDRFGTLYRQLNVNSTDAEKLFNLLAQPTEIKDTPDAKDLIVTDGVIEFDNVTFSYNENVQALKGVSFRIGKGESMALVGESGSGKSTILRLLYRFYDIDSGTIYIDGQDISKVTQSSLRHAIGIVPQDSVLWNDTIGANISYGKEGATDEEIIAAAKAAKLHDRIMTFPEQYATIVGERGVRLSGGEKQRVSLARMFLKNPSVLVLDEATSALDTETEKEIQKSLAQLSYGRTSLSIAHRLSTVVNSTQLVVMKDGRVLEHGSYQQLIELDGQFAKMWKKQIFTEAELASGTSAYALTAPPGYAFGASTPIPGSSTPEKTAGDDEAVVIHRASPPSTVDEHEDEPVTDEFGSTADMAAKNKGKEIEAAGTGEPEAAVAQEPPLNLVSAERTSVRFDDSAPSSRPDSPVKKPSGVSFPAGADTPRSSTDSPGPSAARVASYASERSLATSEHSLPSDSPEAPPEKRRKRLSSIKGFVRRMSSDQSNQQPLLSRSNSGGGGSGSEGGKKRNVLTKRRSVHE
ncbi:uncharacterized protein EHS24_005748 [Apiotrichum porosum]|uniref:Uncharacterized protein n=1 Tax=Apiotrichum porosum TaxID=105984 RepID=A0A427XZC3_9TREE|nr:uncharacterized protein EHS24_005748 [Apiotrichum porosum]RSH84236.1 hypothetical protein EHS24_005748 [Apiotrichum porosum]